MFFKKLLSTFNPTWTPRLCDLLGFGCLVLAIGIAFGVAPALAATGIALLIIGYSLA